MARCNENNLNDMLSFLYKAPCEDKIIAMDCNDYCEVLARVADQVAAGANLQDLLPALEEHIRHWKDCREEFEALVAVIKAEENELLDKIVAEIAEDISKDDG